MSDAVRINGLRDFRRGLNQIEKGSAKLLNVELKAVAQATIVPEARSLAPVASGRLRNSIRAGTRGDRITVRSPLPYANARHWGRTKNRRGGQEYAQKVVGVPFIYGAVQENREKLTRELARELDRFIERQLPRS